MKIRTTRLDRLFSSFIRMRAGGRCEYCGQKKKLECSHFHGRRKVSTRYNPDNAIGVCFSCHVFLGEHPNLHSEFFKKRLGSDRYEKLNILANQTIKPDLENIEKELKEKIELLEDAH